MRKRNKAVICGCEYHFTDSGGSAEVLVFLHGLLWNGDLFSEQIDAFSGEFRCISIDLKGQGGSEITSSGYSIDQQAKDVFQLLEKLGVVKFHLVGLSMGGYMALRIAIWHPKRVSSLCILCSSAGKERFWKTIQYRSLAVLIRVFGMRIAEKTSMSLLFAREFLEDPESSSVLEQLKLTYRANRPSGVARQIHGIVTRDSVESQLGQIVCPVLCISGAKDKAIDPSCGQRIASNVNSGKFVLLQQVGHTPPIEDAESLLWLMQDFLAEHKAE